MGAPAFRRCLSEIEEVESRAERKERSSREREQSRSLVVLERSLVVSSCSSSCSKWLVEAEELRAVSILSSLSFPPFTSTTRIVS